MQTLNVFGTGSVQSIPSGQPTQPNLAASVDQPLERIDLASNLRAVTYTPTESTSTSALPSMIDRFFARAGDLSKEIGLGSVASGIATTAVSVFPQAMAIGEGLSLPKRVLIGVAGVALIAIGRYLLDIARGKELTLAAVET